MTLRGPKGQTRDPKFTLRAQYLDNSCEALAAVRSAILFLATAWLLVSLVAVSIVILYVLDHILI